LTSSEIQKKTRSFNIYKNKEFQANPLARTPNDNSIAISSHTTKDTIVSVSNSEYYIYLPDGTLLGYSELDSFVINAGLTPHTTSGLTNMGDPKIVWDNNHQRFVMSFLSFGYRNLTSFPNKSKLYVAISITSNPLDGWYINEINDSDYLPVNKWIDRPELALSNDEIIITAQTSFDEADTAEGVIIFGLEKSNAYSGLPTIVYDIQNIKWNGVSIAPLFPVRGSQANYGPGLYFTQVPEASTGNLDTLRLFDLTNDLSNSGTLNAYAVKIDDYSRASFPKQPNQKLIGNNNNRITDAIYTQGSKNYIQGVFTCKAPNSTAYSQIDIFNLNVSTLAVNERHLYFTNKDIFYPSISNFAKNGSSTHDVIVSYLKTDSINTYASYCAIGIDTNLLNGSELNIKLGSQNKSNLRWGDYTGLCRKHDASIPTVWAIGSYCAVDSVDSVWIAEITNLKPNAIEEQTKKQEIFTIFPNPTSRFINLQSNLDLSNANINFLSMDGKVIQSYTTKRLNKNVILRMDIQNIPTGNYIITIKNNDYANAQKITIY